MDRIPYLGKQLARWRVGPSTFLALPEEGARLMNWNTTLGDGSVRDVIYWPELADGTDLAKVRGGNPILFPFVARTFDRGDIHHWRDPHGVRRDMPMHGFARQSAFRVTRLDAHGFAATLVPGEEARACYPYTYEFTVDYRFAPLGLTCEFALENLGTEPIPWCAGHHFYFTVPWSEGSNRSDYLIRIPATQHLRQDAAGQLVPAPPLGLEEPLDHPALIDTLHLGLRRNTVVFGERGRPGDVTVSLGTERVPPPDATIVTWTADAAAPYYCVEPWMGPANAPEHHRGLHFVAPGAREIFTVSIALQS
jgi:galactose mutarotase-like enzyme